MSAPVHLETRPDGVGVITLNRPERLNALSSELAVLLLDLVRTVDVDDDVRAIVVAGEGRVFCAGADIEELDTLDGPAGFSQFVSGLTDAFGVLAASPKPSIAAVHGIAMGGGLELALACDLRVVEEGARLGLPEIKLGLLPGAGGTARLPRLVPTAVATRMLLTGEPVSAEVALRLGLVTDVVPAGGAMEAALGIATTLAALPPLALSAAKRLLAEGPNLELDDAIELERRTVSELFGTADRVEGVRSFLEKRAARFEGR